MNNALESMTTLETLARDYEAQGAEMDAQLAEYKSALAEVQGRFLKALKRQAGRTAAAESALRDFVGDHPDLFVKPRLMTVHGVKVGMRYGEGSLVWEDDLQVVLNIVERLPDLAAELVKVTRTPIKDKLRSLTPEQLDSIGCRIENAGDTVIVRRVSGEIEKALERLQAELVKAAAKND
jgi:hypothetical protein